MSRHVQTHKCHVYLGKPWQCVSTTTHASLQPTPSIWRGTAQKLFAEPKTKKTRKETTIRFRFFLCVWQKKGVPRKPGRERDLCSFLGLWALQTRVQEKQGWQMDGCWKYTLHSHPAVILIYSTAVYMQQVYLIWLHPLCQHFSNLFISFPISLHLLSFGLDAKCIWSLWMQSDLVSTVAAWGSNCVTRSFFLLDSATENASRWRVETVNARSWRQDWCRRERREVEEGVKEE